MIIPVLFLFQLLLSASLYSTHLFVRFATRSQRIYSMQQLLLYALSQVNIAKVVTLFGHKLQTRDTAAYRDSMFALVKQSNGMLKNRKSMF